MTQLSPPPAAIDSNRLQATLQSIANALASTSLDILAKAIDKDDTQASRIRSNQLGVTVKDFGRLIHAAGLKCVSIDKVCVARKRYEAMVEMTSAAMSDQETVHRLMWDE